jgi:hypothetical protein
MRATQAHADRPVITEMESLISKTFFFLGYCFFPEPEAEAGIEPSTLR